jgi:hypothetical protein
MAYGIGILLALFVFFLGRLAGFDRDRAFYATMVIVVASYYVLFAVMGGTEQALFLEVAGMSAFLVAAVAGFRSNMWIVAAALAGHGIFDFVHGYIISNAGVPAWWPSFCAAFDIVAGCGLAWLLSRSAVRK